MEAEISQRRPKALPATQNASQTSSGEGAKFKFGQLILRKIIKIVATRCQILRLKMLQIRFRLGLRPRPRWRAHSTPPRALS